MKKLLNLALGLLLLSCSSDPKESIQIGVDLSMAEYRKAHISNINYELDFNIPADKTASIEGFEIIKFDLSSTEQDIQLDFNVNRESLKSIEINGEVAEIDYQKEHIILAKELLQEGTNIIEINFHVGDGSLNRQDEFLYTLFVPDRARTAFPLFDQPNLKATYTLNLSIPANWNAISNAPLKEEVLNTDHKRLEFEPSDLMSSYLFSFVAGEFQKVTKEVNGRTMTMLHRETDEEKVARNLDEIFNLHASSIKWMEDYTGIDYPFQKFDFALIPGFQYGGMEHVGAIQYRANSLMLDEDPSQNQRLGRASLIGHETAHMWFGDLVTMDWFNDVWTKEVFANFMAAKMVNPSFPEIDHDLNFLLRHYPSAYGVDRTAGANPIRQELQNLNEAGQMYGAIIYNKAPIMMRQLELILGKEKFRLGLQEYLERFSFNNATWPDLIDILDKKTEIDLKAWSQVWVNAPGRPVFKWSIDGQGSGVLAQYDPSGNKTWPQQLYVGIYQGQDAEVKALDSSKEPTVLAMTNEWQDAAVLLNAKGVGYGLFATDFELFSERWERFTDLEKGSLLINAFENLIEPGLATNQDIFSPQRYLAKLKWLMIREKNPLLISQILRQCQTVFWSLLEEKQRLAVAPDLERTLFHCLNDIHDDVSIKKSYFNAFRNVAITGNNINRLYRIWKGEESIRGVRLSENDMISLASQLALKMPAKSEEIIEKQLEEINNPDSKRRFEFVRDALSADKEKRDARFNSFMALENREIESWVLTALGYLHHPLRTDSSVEYIKPSLDLLQEIQVTGDIFFPKRWLDQTLSNHSSDEALAIVEEFLSEHPAYNKQLKMKILQSVDFAKRANAVKKAYAGIELK